MTDCVFIYHHIVSSIFFYNHVNDPTSYWKLILFYAEISNIPSQIVYYLIQQKRINGESYNYSFSRREIYTILYIWVSQNFFNIFILL